uniref:Uncharacterized protein n=1 Tax=Pararge aegeria TaxID=116150 RepID=S4PTB0_9NEOP
MPQSLYWVLCYLCLSVSYRRLGNNIAQVINYDFNQDTKSTLYNLFNNQTINPSIFVRKTLKLHNTDGFTMRCSYKIIERVLIFANLTSYAVSLTKPLYVINVLLFRMNTSHFVYFNA